MRKLPSHSTHSCSEHDEAARKVDNNARLILVFLYISSGLWAAVRAEKDDKLPNTCERKECISFCILKLSTYLSLLIRTCLK